MDVCFQNVQDYIESHSARHAAHTHTHTHTHTHHILPHYCVNYNDVILLIVSTKKKLLWPGSV